MAKSPTRRQGASCLLAMDVAPRGLDLGSDDGRQEASPVALADIDNPYGPAVRDGSSSENQSQAGSASGPESEIEVDERMPLSQDMSRIVDQEDINWVKHNGDLQEVNAGGDVVEEPSVLEPQEDDDTTPHASPSKYVISGSRAKSPSLIDLKIVG